ncbi:MAG: hypothetical protein D6681_19775 [Calditrichaeota bacterium]|nr:MAG: hypothetical protein D6681_19775 [Calditrichota bacterium]
MGTTFTIPLNQIRMASALQNTNLITFPVEMMRKFHLSVGIDVVVHLSQERRLLLTVGIPPGNDAEGAVVNLDPVYEFIRGEEGREMVRFEKLASRNCFPYQKAILLFNRENSLRKVVEWLKTRPGVNTNVVYSIDGDTRCMFAQENFQTVTAVVPVFDAYYTVEEFQACRELWEEVCNLHREEEEIRRHLIRSNAEMDRYRRENERYRQQLRELQEQCELEKARVEALLSLGEIDFSDIARYIQKLSGTLKHLKKKGENRYFSAGDLPEMPFWEEELSSLKEALEKAGELLEAPEEAEDGFEKSRSVRLAAELGHPPPLAGRLEDYRKRLEERKEKISKEAGRLEGRLKELRRKQRQLRRVVTALNGEAKDLESRKAGHIRELQQKIGRIHTSIHESRLPESNFLVKRLETLQTRLTELLATPEKDDIDRLSRELWQEFHRIHICLQRLKEARVQQQEEQARGDFDV